MSNDLEQERRDWEAKWEERSPFSSEHSARPSDSQNGLSMPSAAANDPRYKEIRSALPEKSLRDLFDEYIGSILKPKSRE